MGKIWRVAAVCLVLAGGLPADVKEASKLYKQGRKAEKAGDIVEAYLLYARAAAADPNQPRYWQRSQALRTQAALKAKPAPAPAQAPPPDLPPAEPVGGLSRQDLEDLRRLQPPPELKPAEGDRNFNLRGPARDLFERMARECGLKVVFDRDYQPGPQLSFQLDSSTCRAGLHALEAATASFIVPLDARLMLVAQDNLQKRTELEPTVAISIPIPGTISVQEAQELGRSVQQTMEITKFAVDGMRQIVMFRDRLSKVRPAQALFLQLAQHRAQVELEVEFLEVQRSSILKYGISLPTQFPLFYLGQALHSAINVPSSWATLATFGGGKTLVGVGLSSAQAVATLSAGSSRNLLSTFVRSLDGQPATLHIGTKYPVISSQFVGVANAGLSTAFNYEDLGLSLKVTPKVHGTEGVSLDLDTEFKVLTGQSFNGIPVISSRKLTSKIRLDQGEWAVVAGLMNSSEAKSISGIWGLANLPFLGPLFQQRETDKSSSEVLLILKPRLIYPAPDPSATFPVYVGSETRLRTVL